MKTRRTLLSLALVCAFLWSFVPMTASAASSYHWPVPDCTTVSQGYKSGHTALDIAGKRGQYIGATKAGTVFMVYTGCQNNNMLGSGGKGCNSTGCSPNCGLYTNSSGFRACNWGYGNGVILQHSDGSGYSMYAHMKDVYVKKGATVAAGACIGTMGSTGNSTGAHLHFELTKTVQKSGTYYKPTAPINSSKSAISYVYQYGMVDSGGASAGSGTSTKPTAATMGVTFSLPTEATYKNKVKLYNTNAVMCNQITKKAGVKVTKMGMYLYDAKGSLLKKYTENVSGLVSDSNPRYHSWYDMNSEVGVTLTPGTTYKYQFFGVFNGVECKGPTYSFTTTGTAPVTPPSEPVTPPAPVEPPPVVETPEIPVVWGSVKVTHSENLSGGVMVFTKDNISLNIDVEKPAGLGLQSLTFQVTDRYGQVVLRPTYYADELAKVTADTSFTASVRLFEAAPDYLTFGDTYYCQVVTKAETGQTFTGDTWTLRVEQEEQPPVLPSASLIELTINSQYMYVNGHRQTIDAQGSRPQVNSDNRTILPVRAVFEAMGGTVGWNNDSRTVSLSLEGTTLYLKIDSYIMRDSQGNSYRMDTRPVIINGRTFLPIRPVVEYFGGDVGWNQNTQTVTIQY